MIKDLFYEVLELRAMGEHDKAVHMVQQACPDLRVSVEKLLLAHDQASGLLLDDAITGSASEYPEGDYTSDQPKPTIPGYEIADEIGRGGFGIVYRARQLSPISRSVAIKVLRRELISQQVITRFRAESVLLARMSHESIAKVYDAGFTDQGQPFVAMEFMDGKPLNIACDDYDLGAFARIELMASVCDAVHHAHQRAIIHRDLKPANILVEKLREGFRPRVIDFGIAKLLDADPSNSNTQASVRLGTPRYMSPEQRDGTSPADTRVDIYALGALLCELLAGDVPASCQGNALSSQGKPKRKSEDGHPCDVDVSRVTRPSRIASELGTHSIVHPRTLRGDLDRIVLKACAADPDLRYPSAQALADDLRNYLAGRPINATPPGVLYLTRKFVRRHRASVSLAGILGVALFVALGITAIKWNEANEQRDRAISSAERTTFIGKFLIDLLLLTADSNERGAPSALSGVAMQQIADRAAEGLEEDPEHMLSMLVGIGRLQAQAGQPQAGAETLRRALSYATGSYGNPSPHVIEIRIRLHDLLWGHGITGWKEQIQLADEESAVLFANDDPKRMRVIQRADGSTENLETIIARYEELDEIDPADRYHALFAYIMQQRFGPTPEKQLETTRKLYEVAMQYYPPNHTVVIDAMTLYGEAMTVYEPTEQTVLLLLDAYERSVNVLGADHFSTEAVRRSLARAYGAVGQPEKGISYAIADIESVTRQYGLDSIQYSNAILELGKLYQLSGELDQARHFFEQSLNGRRLQWSAGHAQITTAEVLLAQALLDLGELEEADELAESAVVYLRARRDVKTYAAAMRVRIKIQEMGGEDGAAEELLNEARNHMDLLGLSSGEIDQMLGF